MTEKKIIVLFPTWTEARPFVLRHTSEAEAWQCGIGSAECAARTAAIIISRQPEIIILAGVAGATPDSGLCKGETVTVTRENVADLGAVRAATFHPLSKTGTDPLRNYYENRTQLPSLFKAVISDTVATAGTPFRNRNMAALIENMEGAAFFAVCRTLGVRYAEIRCISNYLDENRSDWIIEQTAANLAEDLSLFIREIETERQ